MRILKGCVKEKDISPCKQTFYDWKVEKMSSKVSLHERSFRCGYIYSQSVLCEVDVKSTKIPLILL